MFFRWFIIIIKECNIDIKKNIKLSDTKYMIIGNDIKLIIADKPDILFIKNISNQTNIIIIPTIWFNANKKPNEVATPFPPLRLLKIENICPSSSANENIYPKVRLSVAKIYIGIKPFKKSPRNVTIPANGPS